MGGGSTLTGVLVAGGFALAGAIVAALTAGVRQRQQLAHERELRDLDELRRVLDEISGWFATFSYRIVIATTSEAVDTAVEHGLEEGGRFEARLSLRIGEDTEVVKALVTMSGIVEKVADAKSEMLQGNEEAAGKVGVAWKEYEQATDEYYAAARRLVGARLPGSSPN